MGREALQRKLTDIRHQRHGGLTCLHLTDVEKASSIRGAQQSQIVSRRGEDGQTDSGVCRGTSGLQPDLCDVTRPRARPEARGAGWSAGPQPGAARKGQA